MSKSWLICLLFLLSACSGQQPIEFKGRAMGGSYDVKIAALPVGVTENELGAQIKQQVDAIEHAGSTYLGNSELNQINRAKLQQPVKVSPLAFELIQFAVSMAKESNGAYEPTIGPLVDAWGFGPQIQPEHWLADETIAELKKRVGYQFVEFDSSNSAIKRTADVELNVNGVMQGFAADKVATLLERNGCQDYLVNILGEVKARGHKADQQQWNIAIETPNYDNDLPHAVEKLVSLDGKGMATSGNYRNYYELDGKRISHIINPFTGRPIENRVASVSVVDASAARADGLTKPLMIMGEEEGVAWAKQKGISALFIIRDGNGFKEVVTGDFAKFVTN
ncbi:MAG TPA: FAD:protein FMN transferase [Pseudomonadales bacterium]|nr:FAD:protein FMN transferase [Pseudomonadales bacterium]